MNFFHSGRRSQKQFNENDFKARKFPVDKHVANRSFTSVDQDDETILKRQRSQSYTEGKGHKINMEVKKSIKTGPSSKCSSDEQSSRTNDELIESKLDNEILDNVVREGRYFLGENLGRMTRDIDGSRTELDTLEDDQLEWDDEPDDATDLTESHQLPAL